MNEKIQQLLAEFQAKQHALGIREEKDYDRAIDRFEMNDLLLQDTKEYPFPFNGVAYALEAVQHPFRESNARLDTRLERDNRRKDQKALVGEAEKVKERLGQLVAAQSNNPAYTPLLEEAETIRADLAQLGARRHRLVELYNLISDAQNSTERASTSQLFSAISGSGVGQSLLTLSAQDDSYKARNALEELQIFIKQNEAELTNELKLSHKRFSAASPLNPDTVTAIDIALPTADSLVAVFAAFSYSHVMGNLGSTKETVNTILNHMDTHAEALHARQETLREQMRPYEHAALEQALEKDESVRQVMEIVSVPIGRAPGKPSGQVRG